jgi:hypothetical protein
MVIETDAVGAALERVRQADPGHTISLSELVVLGAERKLELIQQARGDDERRAELRERFLARTRTGIGIDWDALQDMHDRRWAHAADG